MYMSQVLVKVDKIPAIRRAVCTQIRRVATYTDILAIKTYLRREQILLTPTLTTVTRERMKVKLDFLLPSLYRLSHTPRFRMNRI